MEIHTPTPPAPASATEDQEILKNIDGRLHGPMSGFIKKFFGHFQYVNQGALLEIKTAGRVSCRCAVPSAAPSPDGFLQWFSNYISRELDGARGSWRISSRNEIPGRESDDGDARILLDMTTTPTPDSQTRWDDIQIIGQFYRRRDVCYQYGLLRLCQSAYEVFASQPTRLFLHGFYIRGSLVELWMFDRSGLYCSDMFDIRNDFIQFLSIILSYQRMTDKELGITDTLNTDEGGSYVDLNGAAVPSLRKLYLESQPIASRDKLVGNGTTCYRARTPDSDQWSYVLKFKWRWARERPEDKLLRLAKEKCVWGAISLDYYEEAESTANLRRGLRWGTHRKFSNSRSIEEEKRDDVYSAGGLIDYTEETDNYFQNRILACVVTSPVGRPLDTFQSVLELLQVFCNAIRCHRSLYYDANILHQDISPGNIVILDGQMEGKSRGILIDLDSAVELVEALETEIGITGTRPFMAIGVLRNERHTYRHDLESFLYVFLWTIITNHAESPPETSKLRQWSNGSWNELATRKSFDMDQGAFENILREFPHEFHSLKPVAENLRQTLFPLQNGAIWTGTDGSPEGREKLYDEIIHVFEEAIACETGRSGSPL
ncbi:FunK1 protein kinase [Xylaria cf. heliscus]|nr:FunK1 protein kinase [Xylaria cf. heliscus]